MRYSLLPLAIVVSAASALAQGQTLEHQPVSCFVAGQYPRLRACVADPDDVTAARVFFRAGGTSTWYHVVMARDAACFAGALPRPKQEMIGRRVDYYVEVEHRRLGAPRTDESHPWVVRSASACHGPLVAAIAASGPAAVLPALPAGFAAGGLGAGTVAAVVGGGLAAGGAAVAVAAGGGDGGSAEPAPPTTAAPATTVPPTTTTTLPVEAPFGTGGPLTVTCSARPDSGDPPLTVQFQASASGGDGPIALRWDFGDGESINAPVVQHVYRTSGRFDATARATSGGQVERCTKRISVAAEPLPRFTLSVSRDGTGDGGVTSTPGGIDCGGACAADFEQGTAVRLTAKAATNSTFHGWGGACGGTGACTVTVGGPLSVSATFDLAQATLTVQKAGSGSGNVISMPPGIDCGADCSETYPIGTQVAIRALPDAGSTFTGWSGACSGIDICNLTINGPTSATAKFDLAAATGRGTPAPEVPRATTWLSRLERGSGVVRVGPYAASAAAGTVLLALPAGPGEVRIELELAPDAGTAVWSLESQTPDAVEPGTLRVLAGQPVSVGPAAVAFRLRPGERAAFAFRSR